MEACNPGDRSRLEYNPALDGVRAVAVLVVLAFHARLGGTNGGFLGVDVFFVLSGYLITRMLADRKTATGRVAIGPFYVRRLKRLYPALILFLLTYALVAPYAFPEYADHKSDALLAILYLTDYSFALWQTPWFIQHTWSLSVEQHFYLAWPLFLAVIFRLPLKAQAPTILGMAIAATAWRWYVVSNVDPWQQPYYRFDTRLSGLLLGSAAGILRLPAPRAAAWLGLLAILWVATQAYVEKQSSLTKWMCFAELGSALLIMGAHHIQPLRYSPVVWVGKLSYGIYLWHYPIMVWLRRHDIIGWESLMLAGGASLALAYISYETVERIFRLHRHCPAVQAEKSVLAEK